MARTYDEMVTLVRNWSNRDVEALPDPIIQDSLRWAADKAYRRLRVPPLEHRLVYDSNTLETATSNLSNRFASVTELQIPPDLIEFIQIREIDAQGATTRLFNEKADVRTFNDIYAEKYNTNAFWTRFQNCIQISPGFNRTGSVSGSSGVGNPEGIELYYYRRLPALDARYDVNATNATAGVLLLALPADDANANVGTVYSNAMITVAENGDVTVVTPQQTDADGNDITDAEGNPVFETLSYVDIEDTSHPNMHTFYGSFVPNWLREENERVLLMGALAEVFFYLQENEEAQKYAALFTQEIQELNVEDQMRNASGGNVQINFNGRGLI